MWTTPRWLVLFVLFNFLSCKLAFRHVEDMNWTRNPATAWPPLESDDHFEHRNVILLLNVQNYSDNSFEKTFIATGVLIDNSRILTSYNPFRKLLDSSNITDNILALLPTGMSNDEPSVPTLKIADISCGRQIAYVSDDDNYVWHDQRHSPLHDLMVIRMEEEIGIAISSIKYTGHTVTSDFYWEGELENSNNCMISFPAGIKDHIDTKVRIFSLGYRNQKEMQYYDMINRFDYEDDDAVLVDCEEWLPRQWGFFFCIRNIDNLPGLGSGATLFSKNKLFGIGSFAMFKNDTSILVFTDVRYYEKLIMKTCGDQEFTQSNLTTLPSTPQTKI